MFTNHHIPLARLDKSSTHKFDFVPSNAQLNEIIENLALRKLVVDRFEGTLEAADRGWNLSGKLDAVVTQNCVISGAPVHTKVHIKVERKYRADNDASRANIELLEDFDDSIDPLPVSLELNEVVGESIALNIPAFPKLRKFLEEDEWSISSENFDEEENVELQKPFAGLEALLQAKKNDNSNE